MSSQLLYAAVTADKEEFNIPSTYDYDLACELIIMKAPLAE